MHVIVMGVCGCGKSTLGRRLAEHYQIPFLEGDALHSPHNVEKMASGIALTDEDRWPWLRRVGAALAEQSDGAVAGCSALKKSYRDLLRETVGRDTRFIFLHGAQSLLLERLMARKGHYMPSDLLQSQLDTLDIPDRESDVCEVDIACDTEEQLRRSLMFLEREDH